MGKKAVNWTKLWRDLRTSFLLYGKPRQAAVLDNFRESKEKICRRLGVVTPADVSRITQQIKRNS